MNSFDHDMVPGTGLLTAEEILSRFESGIDTHPNELFGEAKCVGLDAADGPRVCVTDQMDHCGPGRHRRGIDQMVPPSATTGNGKGCPALTLSLEVRLIMVDLSEASEQSFPLS